MYVQSMADFDYIARKCLVLLLPLFLILTLFYLTSFHQNLLNNINITTPHPLPPLPSTISPTKVLEEDKKSTGLKRIEVGLGRARAAIRKAGRTWTYTSEEEESFIPRGTIYRNPYAFHQSHIEMVKRFKIWTYKEGEPPFIHQGPMRNIYGVEGQFIGEIESNTTRFVARHPNEAHAFFLPFSVTSMVSILYNPVINYDLTPLERIVQDYVTLMIHKYPFWNRSLGADHFMVSCHDWAPLITKNPELFKNLIRSLCNANTSEGFQPKRDVPIPEVKIPVDQLGPPFLGLPLTNRSIFAFFAGGAHGHVRKFLFKHWFKRDKEIQLNVYLPKGQNYSQMLGQSKFCLCPSGYEVASPRIVEAIHAECVPVIIKDNYSFPFSDVLDWSQFSVHIPMDRIPEIKTILKGISESEYMKLVEGVRRVKWHFTINRPAKKFDLLHMILHSIWLRRLNFRVSY